MTVRHELIEQIVADVKQKCLNSGCDYDAIMDAVCARLWRDPVPMVTHHDAA